MSPAALRVRYAHSGHKDTLVRSGYWEARPHWPSVPLRWPCAAQGLPSERKEDIYEYLGREEIINALRAITKGNKNTDAPKVPAIHPRAMVETLETIMPMLPADLAETHRLRLLALTALLRAVK